jgi:hypothetical protein
MRLALEDMKRLAPMILKGALGFEHATAKGFKVG